MNDLPGFETVHACIDYWARLAPDREALVAGDVRLTFTQTHALVEEQAAGLLSLGVHSGDRVAVLGPPSPEFFVSFLAIVSLGGIYLGLNPKMTDDEIGYQLDDATPRFLVHHSDREHRDRAHALAAAHGISALSAATLSSEARSSGRDLVSEARAIARSVTGPQAAAIVYTSGSTGRPKGALLPHRGFTGCYAIQNRRWLPGEGERAPVVEPINHVAAVGDETFALVSAGGTAVLMEDFDPEGLLTLIERERITFWYADPAILGMCVRSPRWRETDFSALRRVVWSGGRAPLPLVQELRRLGVTLGTSWGMTETVGSVIYTDDDADDETLSRSLGRPDAAYETALVDGDGKPVSPGEPGELCVRSPDLMLGYFQRPEATRSAMDHQSWLHTGDLVRARPDGNLELVGRLSDMFKSGGENIYPREVEQVLEAHPTVSAAAVVARPHDLWGEVGCAFVVARGAVTDDELREHARARLARYKVPKTFLMVPELPILPSGKVDRRTLTDRAARSTRKEEIER